ncbi:hypothetical protein L3X38_032251 [Prunus dulcis]|uniref:Uncharacterized protein n=1 Tax=Prunus dulcis TaxID=3755 RepID=A0AAD4VF41_PRUDU|nr:hypothetical protein L3X38_032251 [Prunus dulcis]
MRKVLFVLFLLCFLQAATTKKEGEKRNGTRIEEISWEFFKYTLLLSFVCIPSYVTVYGVWMWNHLDHQQRLRVTLVIIVALAVLALSNSLIWTWSPTVLHFGKQHLEHLALALSSGVVTFVWAVFYHTNLPPPPPANGHGSPGTLLNKDYLLLVVHCLEPSGRYTIITSPWHC